MSWNERGARRLDLIIEAIDLGMGADEIDDFVNEGLRKLGPQSEDRVFEIVSSLSFVEKVRKGSGRDDDRGKDLRVFYRQGSGHRTTSIQVKSSWASVQEFRSRYRNEELKEKRIIVLNAGPQVSRRKVRRSFIKQLKDLDGRI